MKTDGSITGSPLIHSFTNGTAGDAPENGLRLVNGRLYGTTVSGGANGGGALFSLAEDGSGFVVLPLPSGSGSDLSVDTDGLLYGSLSDGGNSDNDGEIFQSARRASARPACPRA